MRPDSDVKKDVLSELDWEPEVTETEIGVIVKDGAVTLTGWVPSYLDKLAAKRAAKRVTGVRAVADEIEVRLPSALSVADDEIARRVAHILEWGAGLPADVKAEVDDGLVTLSGTADWHYQRNNAKKQVEAVKGVTSVINNIVVRQRATPADVKKQIESALHRHADVEAGKIRVSVIDGTVTLSGEVDSVHEMDLVEDAAWATPGVVSVRDDLRLA